MDSNPLLQSIAQQVAPTGAPKGQPKLQFSVPCFEVDYKSGKPPSLYYMFYDLPFPELPRTVNFNIVNGWIGGQKDSGLYQEIYILQPDGSTHLASGQQKLEFVDQNTPFMLVNSFPKIPFETAGLYNVSVRLSGKEVLRYPISVREVGQQGPKPPTAP